MIPVRRFLLFALLAGVVYLPAAPAAALSALEIMERVDARDDGDNGINTIDMTLIDKRDNKRRRRITSYTKDKGADTQRLMFFQSPADVRGTGFLTYDYHDAARDDDQWLYLPELRKTKRIASSDKSGSFMGSDFSYADMTKRVIAEWTYKILKEDTVRDDKVWLIETLPASPEVRARYGYTKSIVFVRQDIFMVVRAVHWLNDGKLKYLDIKALEKIDGIWVGTLRDMKTVKNRQTLHRTELRFHDVKFGQDLDENMFSTRRLEKGE